jgi:ABC-2 type transport system ATP-binding protein
VSSLDPLARREFLQHLMEAVAEHDLTVVLSSHLIADVERVCDHLVVVAGGRVVLADEVDELLAGHKLLTGPRRDPKAMPTDHQVIQASHTDRQTTMLVRTDRTILDPAWTVTDIGLEELVLAYMAAPPQPSSVEQRAATPEVVEIRP